MQQVCFILNLCVHVCALLILLSFLFINVFYSYICCSHLLINCTMKLFITNKSFMDEDTSGNGKEAHQLAYKSLRKYLIEEETIPLNLLVSVGSRNYYFNFSKADYDKDIYQYEYSTMIMG